jgi:hypothetical protein
LYFLPIRWAGHVARTREKRNTYRVLADITWKRSLGRPKHKGKDNFNMDLTEIRWEDVDWINLARVGISDGCWKRGNEHLDVIKRREFFDWVSNRFWKTLIHAQSTGLSNEFDTK